MLSWFVVSRWAPPLPPPPEAFACVGLAKHMYITGGMQNNPGPSGAAPINPNPNINPTLTLINKARDVARATSLAPSKAQWRIRCPMGELCR